MNDAGESLAQVWRMATAWSGERFGWRGIVSTLILGGVAIWGGYWLLGSA